MSRSGYSEYDGGPEGQWALIRWRGAVKSAIRGKRGQAILREMLAALDAMPEKALISDALEDRSVGAVCALGAVGKARGMDMRGIDPHDREAVAKAFGIAEALAAEIEFVNDDEFYDYSANETPEQRWKRVRAWVVRRITPAEPSGQRGSAANEAARKWRDRRSE